MTDVTDMTNQGSKKKILVADDDVAILDAVKIMLEIADYDVCTEADGGVVEKVRKEKPHLVLLDIWMSGVDGRNICRQLKADAELRKVPIILISASKDLARSCQAAGAEDYIEKPFEMDELLEKIEQLIASAY